MRNLLLTALIILPNIVQADISLARQMMSAGRFEDARAEIQDAVRTGNAEAEEMMGVMYGLGLGLEQDDRRSFEWYLRAAMKGHPGAQSGIAWYYEAGRGIPAPDPVRAYMWYALSAIGGDVDAAANLENLARKMSETDIEEAHVLIDDYKIWLFPFK